MSSLSRKLKNLDFYPKIDESYRIKTSSGGFLSLICWALMIILSFSEIRHFLTPQYTEHMVVDTTIGEPIIVNLNITFHALSCYDSHLDVMNLAGENQLNVEHRMIKQRLDLNGNPIGEPGYEIIGEGKLTDLPPLPADYCGSCFGAEDDIRKCCNTCDELIDAYTSKGWDISTILSQSEQCRRQRAIQFTKPASHDQKEGCNVSGSIKFNKVNGNFHISDGESLVKDGRHIHQFNPITASAFNISHTIHSLSFGNSYPNMPVSPLDQVKKIIPNNKPTGLYQYFIRIIPTIYKDYKGTGVQTYQYTVTERFRPLILPREEEMLTQNIEIVLPGIFFIYDISPFMIEAETKKVPFTHLLTKLCAIVGGIMTILSVLDKLVYTFTCFIKKD